MHKFISKRSLRGTEAAYDDYSCIAFAVKSCSVVFEIIYFLMKKY